MRDGWEDDEDDDKGPFRYSLVYSLRPNSGAVIHTAALTTPVKAASHTHSRMCARELFSAIARAHWNVNATHECREAKTLCIKRGAASNGSVGNQRREADGGD